MSFPWGGQGSACIDEEGFDFSECRHGSHLCVFVCRCVDADPSVRAQLLSKELFGQGNYSVTWSCKPVILELHGSLEAHQMQTPWVNHWYHSTCGVPRAPLLTVPGTSSILSPWQSVPGSFQLWFLSVSPACLIPWLLMGVLAFWTEFECLHCTGSFRQTQHLPSLCHLQGSF